MNLRAFLFFEHIHTYYETIKIFPIVYFPESKELCQTARCSVFCPIVIFRNCFHVLKLFCSLFRDNDGKSDQERFTALMFTSIVFSLDMVGFFFSVLRVCLHAWETADKHVLQLLGVFTCPRRHAPSRYLWADTPEGRFVKLSAFGSEGSPECRIKAQSGEGGEGARSGRQRR